MKQNVSPQALVAAVVVIVLLLGIAVWKVFLSSNSGSLTPEEFKQVQKFKDKKEEKGETH